MPILEHLIYPRYESTCAEIKMYYAQPISGVTQVNAIHIICKKLVSTKKSNSSTIFVNELSIKILMKNLFDKLKNYIPPSINAEIDFI